MKSILLFILVILCFSNCKKAEDNLNYSEDVAISEADNKVDQVKFVKPALAKSEEVTVETEQKIIKTATLRFETNDLEATYTQILNAVKNSKATIQNDSEGKDYESVFRNLTVRVPSQNFDVFIASISKGVAYFDTKEITSQDVTAEFIDLDARLKAKKVLENRYLELLKKANKVTEMLEIEKQLSAIREEIEVKEGQLNYMQNQVSYSTITIEFYKSVAEASGATESYGTKIWTAIKSGFNSLSSLFINLLSIWPFILIMIALGYFIRKRFKSKKI